MIICTPEYVFIFQYVYMYIYITSIDIYNIFLYYIQHDMCIYIFPIDLWISKGFHGRNSRK